MFVVEFLFKDENPLEKLVSQFQFCLKSKADFGKSDSKRQKSDFQNVVFRCKISENFVSIQRIDLHLVSVSDMKYIFT